MAFKKTLFLFLLFLLCSVLSASSAQENTQTIAVSDSLMIPYDQAPAAADPILAKKWNQLQTRFFNLNFGVALILDHNITSQDEANVEQVGNVGSGTEFRGQRLIVSGNLLFFKNPR